MTVASVRARWRFYVGMICGAVLWPVCGWRGMVGFTVGVVLAALSMQDLRR